MRGSFAVVHFIHLLKGIRVAGGGLQPKYNNDNHMQKVSKEIFDMAKLEELKEVASRDSHSLPCKAGLEASSLLSPEKVLSCHKCNL